MSDYEMIDVLNKVGKACYAKYYRLLTDQAIPNKDVAELMQKEEGYTSASCATRVSKARSIIRAGRGGDAIQLAIGRRR